MTISAHWQTQIEKWETSGLTRVIFCQQNNLKYSTFCARLSEYRVRHRALPTQAEVKLIPIEVKPELKDERFERYAHTGHLPIDNNSKHPT
jgi:hypothetical protein